MMNNKQIFSFNLETVQIPVYKSTIERAKKLFIDLEKKETDTFSKAKRIYKILEEMTKLKKLLIKRNN